MAHSPGSVRKLASRLDAPLDAAAKHTDANQLKIFRERNELFRRGGVNSADAALVSTQASAQLSHMPCKPRGIPVGHHLSRSMIDPRSAEADELRSKFTEAQSFAIMEGREAPASLEPPPLLKMSSTQQRKTRLVIALSARVLAFGAAAQLCNELIFRAEPTAGDTVSLVEYGFCAFASIGALRQPRRLPWSCHLQLFATGLLYSLLMNAGLAASLPMPLVLVMKNANILANMLVGCIAAGRRYAPRQLAAAALLTAGLVLSTMGGGGGGGGGGGDGGQPATGQTQAASRASDGINRSSGGVFGGYMASADNASDVSDVSDFSDAGDGGVGGGSITAFACGVLALSGALLMRAMGGLAQERAFDAHGIHTNEVMFWRAALGLPVFALRWRRLSLRAWCIDPLVAAAAAVAAAVHGGGDVRSGGLGGGDGGGSVGDAMPYVRGGFTEVVLPRMLLLMVGNVVCDFCTKRAMTRLIGEASALTATMVITLQRFVSLVFSATALSPAYPPPSLWAGIGCVAAGSVMYALQPREAGDSSAGRAKKQR